MRFTISFFSTLDSLASIGFCAYGGLLLNIALSTFMKISPNTGWFIFIGGAAGYFLKRFAGDREQNIGVAFAG